MAYRGEDLDLRTPQNGGRPAADLQSSDLPRRGYRSEPIWVDDTVLACCNLAFDLAVTHRAGEVRLEHLVYAMTRLDAAAEALETRGVKVAGLRREMGNVVASEIPVGLPSSKGTPRRSEELETALRDASDLAQRRNSPAGVDDLAAVLLDGSRELPGVHYLRRHLGRGHIADRGDYDSPLRTREPARTYAAGYDPRPGWSDPAAPSGTRADAIQNSRIEALEQVVRSLGADLANERKTVSALLLDIQRDLGARRDDGGMIDRLGSVELAVDKRLTDISRSWAGLSDRLKGIEAALLARPHSQVEPARLIERMDTIEQVVLERASDSAAEAAKLSDRLKALEDGQAAQKVQALQLNAALAAEVNKLATAAGQSGVERVLPAINERFQAMAATIERQKSELAGTLAQPVGERLTAIGAGLDARQQESIRALNGLGERVAAVERGLGIYVQKISEQASAYDQDLGKIEEELVKLSLGQSSVSGALDQWRQQSGEIGIIGNRLAAIERLTARPAQMLEQLAAKVDDIYRQTAEKAAKRSAFYYWLFGTNDWRAASYPGKRRPAAASVIAQQVARPMQAPSPPMPPAGPSTPAKQPPR